MNKIKSKNIRLFKNIHKLEMFPWHEGMPGKWMKVGLSTKILMLKLK